MSQALRKIAGNASKCNCTVIFLNQLRHKVHAPLYDHYHLKCHHTVRGSLSCRKECRPPCKTAAVRQQVLSSLLTVSH